MEKEKRRKKNQRQSEAKKPPEIVTVMFVPQTPGGVSQLVVGTLNICIKRPNFHSYNNLFYFLLYKGMKL